MAIFAYDMTVQIRDNESLDSQIVDGGLGEKCIMVKFSFHKIT